MVDYYANAPRLRNRLVMPGQMAVKFARFDYGFYEAAMRVERESPPAKPHTPDKLLETDRILSLQEVRLHSEGVLLKHNVPASRWVDDLCGGR